MNSAITQEKSWLSSAILYVNPRQSDDLDKTHRQVSSAFGYLLYSYLTPDLRWLKQIHWVTQELVSGLVFLQQMTAIFSWPNSFLFRKSSLVSPMTFLVLWTLVSFSGADYFFRSFKSLLLT